MDSTSFNPTILIMNTFLTTRIGRLRLLGLLEGSSLLLLIFIAMPIKYMLHNPAWVKAIGPVHGVLFLLFVINTFQVAIEKEWSFKGLTWKVLLACIVPFGTFYIDRKILRHQE